MSLLWRCWILPLGNWPPATLLALGIAGQLQAEPVRPTAGLRIKQSVELEPGTFRLPDPENDGAIVVEGDGITLDLSGVTLEGAAAGTPDNELSGRGIVVHGRNVTIKNARVQAYKVGIYAWDSPGIVLEGCDVSGNYRQHLKSTLDREDLADWLYGHENDHDEWLRYGAGIYLLDCSRATVSDCRARNGQNGLCLVRSDEAHVVDNDMSFLSGWGLAMWRSSRCDVLNNKFDWCIRGYSHGVYSRGQDSAGILVYEQCHDNVFAFNSATHGGDGFFLYAGNETLQQTGTGGCNDNLVYRNDFSHAAANGIEATFSVRNRFIENVLDECDHGVWAGYSMKSVIAGNIIRRCRKAVSVEHGRDNRIVDNKIENAERGVHLWWDNDEDLLASAFCKVNQACPSMDNLVTKNHFSNVKTGVYLSEDTQTRIGDNYFDNVATPIQLRGRVEGLRLALEPSLRPRVQNESPSKIIFQESLPSTPPDEWTTPGQQGRLKERKGQQDAMLPSTALRGRRFIFVDDWGPYDFTNVRLFPTRITGGSAARVNLLGPAGSTFRTEKITGDVSANPQSGSLPSQITLSATRDGLAKFTVNFRAAEQGLSVRGVLLRADWHVSFYSWTTEEDPRNSNENWETIVSRTPLDTVSTAAIDFVWGSRGPTVKVPADHFAAVAKTNLDLPKGRWRFATVSDDGVRVFVDGKPVLSNWTWHGPTRDEAGVDLEAGGHEIRIEYFEIDGYAQLQFTVEPLP